MLHNNLLESLKITIYKKKLEVAIKAIVNYS